MNGGIYICGTGNVATALVDAFLSAGIKVLGMYSRNGNSEYKNIPFITYNNVPEKGSKVFIAVPDDYIGETEKNFLEAAVIAIHCSGSVPMNVLQSKVHGVFYPLQTWTKSTENNWEKVPVFIEGNDNDLTQYLKDLALRFGAIAHESSSTQRLEMHVAAVFANNFSNAVFDIAFQLAEKAGFDPELLMPLIKKTVDKLDDKLPYESQTGPAKRGDLRVMEKHLEMLRQSDAEETHKLAEIYSDLSEWIRQRQGG